MNTATRPSLRLRLLPEEMAVCQLPVGASLPNPGPCSLFSVTQTEHEVSVVCPLELAPRAAKVEPGWRALGVVGPLDFGLTGVLASLALPLADAGIPIFVVSTYDTDYLLVRSPQLAGALEVLQADGHSLV